MTATHKGPGHYDRSGLPLADDCDARHPDTGRRCVEPPGRRPHRGLGLAGMEAFGTDGPEAAASGVQSDGDIQSDPVQVQR